MYYNTVQYFNYQLHENDPPGFKEVKKLLESANSPVNFQEDLKYSPLVATARLQNEIIAILICNFDKENQPILSEPIIDKMFVNNRIEDILKDIIQNELSQSLKI
jgi:hypothetical protein